MRRLSKAFAARPRLIVARVLSAAVGVLLLVLGMFQHTGSPTQIVLVVAGAALIAAAYAMTIVSVRLTVKRIQAQQELS